MSTQRPAILVTNDDGIDSVGLHRLSRAMCDLGDVTVVAPDREYSGAGAAIGALHLAETEARRVRGHEFAGVEAAWSINGPPGLCVFYARMGTFGATPDVIVSGINPGANLGRAVYHSGTVGAVLTGRNSGIPGVAVSQKFPSMAAETGEPEGSSTDDTATFDYDDMVGRQLWDSAAEVAVHVVRGLLESESLDDIAVLNLNVPNLPTEEIAGWRWTEIGRRPPWALTEATLVAKDGEPDAFRIDTGWGEQKNQPSGTDSAALVDDLVSVSWLSRIEAEPWPVPAIDSNLDDLFGEGQRAR